MKAHAIQFTTKKSLLSIANIIRDEASRLHGGIERLEDDPFGPAGGRRPDITVSVSGAALFLGFSGPRQWGYQVYATDLGDVRAVSMVAIGDGIEVKMWGLPFYDLRLGKRHRDEAARLLA